MTGTEGPCSNGLVNQRCDIANASFISVRGNCEDESKSGLLIARDLPEQVREVLCRIRCHEPSNAILTKLESLLGRHATEGNIRMHETEGAMARFSRIGIHFTSHPLGRNRPQEKPLACPARKKKERLEPQSKIVGRNHSVQTAR